MNIAVSATLRRMRTGWRRYGQIPK